MSPKAARAALEFARKTIHDHPLAPQARSSVLDALDEVLRYAESIELRLNQHFNGGDIDHPELRNRL